MIYSKEAQAGAIREARAIGEALLTEPTLKLFASYRRALTILATMAGTTDLSLARAIIIQDELDGYIYSEEKSK